MNGKVKPEMDTPKLEGMEIVQLPSFENVQLPSTNGSSKKKPKLGSKARKLLKLQKQQGQKGSKTFLCSLFLVLCFDGLRI